MKLYISILIVWLFYSCYEDKGNYDYVEINQVELDSIKTDYYYDVDDTLRVFPLLQGSQYDNDERFDFEWEISKKIVSKEKNLVYGVKPPVGQRLCRFIITDKELQTKTYHLFNLHVSSSTAGDLIMVLSNYKNLAEMSYMRLDKPGYNFITNYYLDRFGKALGTDPAKLYQNYFEYGVNSGVQVQTAQGVKCLSLNTLEPLLGEPYLDEMFWAEYYPPYPGPGDLSGYQPESVYQWINMWNHNPYGGINKGGMTEMISGGAYYYMYASSWSKSPKVNLKSPLGGKLSPVIVHPYVKPTPQDENSSLKFRGYDVSSLSMMFDKDNGRFVYSNYAGALKDIENLDTYPGYEFVYGTHLSEYNYCLAVLSNGASNKMIILRAPGSSEELEGSDKVTKIPFEIQGSVDVSPDVMNASTRFYTMKYQPYIFFVTGNKLYRLNFRDIVDGNTPTVSNVVASLQKYGYDENAEISCFYMTRTEKNILLGVSRYGADKTGDSDELKGDVVVIDAVNFNKVNQYEGVSGYPVDIMVKYKYFYRDGSDKDNILRDNI